MRFATPLTIMLFSGAILAAPAFAKDITVQMKNQGSGGMMVFEPAFVQASPGDKIHFMPTDMGHNAQPIAGMMPDGVSEPNGAMNKEYVLTVSKPGLYGIKCLPHFSIGMVALVKVGTGASPNAAAAAAVALPPLAKKRMAPMLASAK
ncbi:pseudoazurin [Sphingomonas sp. AP4-R1]|uniref:pseudoazurin n=1 Tax=Sphingomonas sp. AP4-R1 TaxID=2735134 RepID=UPI001493D4AA|nr:pseudoazurin [Sphingomonas sp. AP4-R1]QJU60099.1 pseudoazurin [Sphingomonas sp. AP4-R1]